MPFSCTDCDYGNTNIQVQFVKMEMEYNSMTDISNIYAKYHPAIYKDFHIIKEMLTKLSQIENKC